MLKMPKTKFCELSEYFGMLFIGTRGFTTAICPVRIFLDTFFCLFIYFLVRRLIAHYCIYHNQDGLSGAQNLNVVHGAPRYHGTPLRHGGSTGHSASQLKGAEGYLRSARRALRCWSRVPNKTAGKLPSSDRRERAARPLKQSLEWAAVSSYAYKIRGTAIFCSPGTAASYLPPYSGRLNGLRLMEDLGKNQYMPEIKNHVERF